MPVPRRPRGRPDHRGVRLSPERSHARLSTAYTDVVTDPLDDPVSEGRRIAEAAQSNGVMVRLTGGVAIALRCPSAGTQPLQRTYADIDVVARRKDTRSLVTFFGSLGYQPDREFNALNGARRQLFWTPGRTRQLDVFVDRYEMCHRLELRDRLDVHHETLSLADLLLTKLQVVETNRKDVVDIATLLSDHPLTQDESGINMGYIASLAASDWPWWRTISMVAERVSLFARDQGLAAGSRRSDPGQRPAGDARAGAEVGPVENAPALATANNGTRSPKRTFENRV